MTFYDFIAPNDPSDGCWFSFSLSQMLSKDQRWKFVDLHFGIRCKKKRCHVEIVAIARDTDIYPLVNQHSYGKSPLLIGKSIITGPFSIAMLNYQRVWRWDSLTGDGGKSHFNEFVTFASYTGWWCNVPILKNDGVRQWEG